MPKKSRRGLSSSSSSVSEGSSILRTAVTGTTRMAVTAMTLRIIPMTAGQEP
jgi:hypothetical protein